MAIVQFPRQQAQPTFRGQLGAGVGEGFSSGIESLIDMKLQKMKQEQQIKQTSESLTPYLGKDKSEVIARLSATSPQLASIVLKEALEGPGQQLYGEALTGQQAPVGGMQQLTPQVPVQQPIEQPMAQQAPERQVAAMAPILEQKQQPIKAPAVKVKPSEPTTKSKAAMAKKLEDDIERMKSYISKVNRKDVPKLQAQIDRKEKRLEKLVINKEREANAQRQFEENKKMKDRDFSFKQEQYQDTLSEKERNRYDKRQDKIDDKYKEFHSIITKRAKNSHVDLGTFEEMKRINNEGGLGSDAFNSFVNALKQGFWGTKIDLTSLTTANAQSLEKLSIGLMKNIADVIGTKRITQSEILLYLRGLPNLMQSKDGRARIIETAMLYNKLAIKEFDVAQDLIEKNHGEIPNNFDSRTYKVMKPFIDDYVKDMKNVANEVRKNEKIRARQPQGLAEEIAKSFKKDRLEKEKKVEYAGKELDLSSLNAEQYDFAKKLFSGKAPKTPNLIGRAAQGRFLRTLIQRLLTAI